MPEDKDTISEAILRWLENNPSWWTRLEIAIGVGRSKTSQFTRALEALVVANFVAKTQGHEGGRDLWLYSLNVHPSDPDLPF
jgi:hypothetical protein